MAHPPGPAPGGFFIPMSSSKDVARLAGVSFTTVSHVLNGTRKVSEDARQRVLRAVAESGYVPSALARSLRVAQTHTLGVLVPDIGNPFCAEITLGVEEVARQARHFDSLLGRRMDGVLLVAGAFEAQSLQSGHALTLRLLAHTRVTAVLVRNDQMALGALRALGGQAALCLVERIRQPERPLRHVRREVTLVLRESTAPPPNTESLTHAG